MRESHKSHCLIFVAIIVFSSSARLFGQATTFAGNAQHTSNYGAPLKSLNTIKWTASNDLNNTGAAAHYGPPLVTEANTVLLPVKTATGFRVDSFDGPSASRKYSLSTDYILPAFVWIPSYNLCLTSGVFGSRLYYPGAGGTLWHIDNPDSNNPGPPVREVFYTTLNGYNGNAAAYNASIFINTPVTADSAGNVYFGFRVQGAAPAPLSTTQSGFARIDVNGNGSFVLAGNAISNPDFSLDSHNLAPALSNDEKTLYVAVKAANSTGYLLALDAATLATKFTTFLRDPRGGAAIVNDNGTSSPMVGPDGDVYFGVLANPSNGSRGFLLHFSADLSVTKIPGAFGWDYTPGVVAASVVPSYSGPSSYLLFCKYNDYAFADGTGVNRVALLDPSDTQIDPHASAPGLTEMREVMTVIGPTPDPEAVGFPSAVKEWCINAPAVNPSTSSVVFNSEDGHLYRWNLIKNSLDQVVTLNAGIGQPYVPSVIGPDGTAYTLNGGNYFALGNSGVEVTISSSTPDLRAAVVNTPLTFTAKVSSGVSAPTGSVTFTDLTYNGFIPATITLASNVILDSNGEASVTTSSLIAAGTNPGNHFITAAYSGDSSHLASSVTMMQKVHASGTTTSLASSLANVSFGDPVTFTATVSPLTVGVGVPTGMVTFRDGATVIGQVPLNASGVATVTRSGMVSGTHNVSATYASDTRFASSTGTVNQSIQGPIIQFSQPNFSVSEGAGSVSLVVTRSGDVSRTSLVSYRTLDHDNFSLGCRNVINNQGSAFARCDFATSIDTLTFAPFETTKSFSIPIIDDAFAEGTETFTVELTNEPGAQLGTPAVATVTINDNEDRDGVNSIINSSFFVRQHYLDFLSREPETGEPWTAILNNCSDLNNDPTCDRLTVSAAFFGSPEFQLKGYFIFRFYRLAFNRMPTYAEIVADMRSVTGTTPDEVFRKKSAFTNSFIGRKEFTDALAATTTSELVATLLGRHGLTQITTPDPANPDGAAKVALTAASLLTQLNNATLTRAQLFRAVADSDEVTSAEFNRAFVAMQYFGYLRRDPDTSGYNAWLAFLNGHPTESRTMVNGFVNSDEYRLRFGP